MIAQVYEPNTTTIGQLRGCVRPTRGMDREDISVMPKTTRFRNLSLFLALLLPVGVLGCTSSDATSTKGQLISCDTGGNCQPTTSTTPAAGQCLDIDEDGDGDAHDAAGADEDDDGLDNAADADDDDDGTADAADDDDDNDGIDDEDDCDNEADGDSDDADEAPGA